MTYEEKASYDSTPPCIWYRGIETGGKGYQYWIHSRSLEHMHAQTLSLPLALYLSHFVSQKQPILVSSIERQRMVPELVSGI